MRPRERGNLLTGVQGIEDFDNPRDCCSSGRKITHEFTVRAVIGGYGVWGPQLVPEDPGRLPYMSFCFCHLDIGDVMELDEFLEYLDDAIRKWRNVRDGIEGPEIENGREIAVYYIDAYQSARKTLTGALLPVDERRR